MSINVSKGELEALLARLEAGDGEKVIEAGMKHLAQRTVDVAKKNTPVDTGQLRRNWFIQEASATRVVVANPAKYAEYVEYGHRQEPGRFVPKLGKRLKHSWVRGQFFAKRSGEIVRKNADKIIRPIVIKEVQKIIDG